MESEHAVHGLIFASLRDYLAAVHGPEIESEVLRHEPAYLLGEAYPDERFEAVVERACVVTGLERSAFLHDLGIFMTENTFAQLYPAIFKLSQGAREFLLTVEQPIHELVRAAIPHALPPKLSISVVDEQRLSIVYTSPRKLCDLLQGLVEGTGRHYREDVRIDELRCMHRGDPTCAFEIRFGPDVVETARRGI
jgi:predicted hydrocarbon binding protein